MMPTGVQIANRSTVWLLRELIMAFCKIVFKLSGTSEMELFIKIATLNNRKIHLIQGGPKKATYFVFHPKVVFYISFPYFSGGVGSTPGRFF